MLVAYLFLMIVMLERCFAGSELAAYHSLGFKFRVGLGNSFNVNRIITVASIG